MNNSFSSNEAHDQIAAWIGMDWADSEHQLCSYDVASGQVETMSLKHSAESLRDWLAGLRKRYHGAKVAVVLEQSRGALLYALMSCDFLVLFPVNPQSLANYRKAFNPSGAKDDPGDAMLLMEMVRKHPERFRPWAPDDPQTRSLRLLVEGRRKLVNQLTRLTNQLTSHLKSYYPQALELAGALNTRGACEFLEQWPTLEALKQARPARLRKFYLKYTRSPAEIIAGRIEQINTAVALTEDEAVVLAGSMMVRVLVGQIRPLIAGIDDFDDQIRRLFQRHPDRLVFESFPGAGLVLAPRLLAAFGADRERWKSAAEIQKLSGIAPVTEKSGKMCWVHWRLACPKFVRQSFHEFASSSIQWCDWARAYYDDLRDHGKGHNTAVRALAYKWIRIMFACWKTRTPYQEDLFLKALAVRGSRLWQLTETLRQAKQAKNEVV